MKAGCGVVGDATFACKQSERVVIENHCANYVCPDRGALACAFVLVWLLLPFRSLYENRTHKLLVDSDDPSSLTSTGR